MKTLQFPGKKIKDVDGLYCDLLEQHFEVENVATGGDCTYVYIHDAEDKDPAPLVDAWIDKEPPESKGAMEERRKTVARLTATSREERAAKEAARAAARLQAEQEPASAEDLGIESLFLTGPAGGTGIDGAPRKESFFSKIFKVFRS